ALEESRGRRGTRGASSSPAAVRLNFRREAWKQQRLGDKVVAWTQESEGGQIAGPIWDILINFGITMDIHSVSMG
ncbi:unnamed protein product, partial [Polarella glacialis]